MLTENDEVISTSTATQWFDQLMDDGAEGQQLEILEGPLPPNRFERVEYFDAERSQIIFDAAVDAGLVDAAGERLVEIAEIDDALDVFTDTYAEDLVYPKMVSSQLKAAWCLHRLNAAYKIETRDFFLDAL